MLRAFKVKKLVSLLAISALVTGASKEAQVIQMTQEIVLDQVFYIYYPM